MKKQNGNTKATNSPTPVEASLALVKQASQQFDGVPQLTAVERKHMAKLRRGVHEIIPLISSLAAKHGLVPPGMSLDVLSTSLQNAQAIEPLLGALAVLNAKVADQHLVHNAAAWKTVTATYAMLDAGARANADIATELEPVKEWFRHRSPLSKEASAAKKPPTATKGKGKRKSKTAATPTQASSSTPATINVVPASTDPKANGALVNGAAAAHAAS